MPEFTDEDRLEVHYFFDKLLKRAQYRREDKSARLAAAERELAELKASLRTLGNAMGAAALKVGGGHG